MAGQQQVIIAARATFEAIISLLKGGIEPPDAIEENGSLLFYLTDVRNAFGADALQIVDIQVYSELRALAQSDITLILCATEDWERFGRMLAESMSFEILGSSNLFLCIARGLESVVIVLEPA